MNKQLFFVLLISIFIIKTYQQTQVSNNQAPFQKFNNALQRSLQEQENEVEAQMKNKLKKQIVIWTSIALVFALYFSVMSIINMQNPKSSILYAKYDTTRGGGNEI